MITFKAIVISSNRRKDGTYPVKIRVTFKGVSRRLPTTLACTANDLTRSLKIKSAEILNKTDQLIARMRKAVMDISPFDLENWDVDRVVARIRDSLSGETFRLDFFQWADKFLTTKSEATMRTYVSSLNAFERFLGKRSIDINDINRQLLLDFVDFINNEPRHYYNSRKGKVMECLNGKKCKIPKAASTRHIMKLQHIFNAAKDKYNDEDSDRILIPKSPFKTIEKIFPPSQGQKNLGQELMQKIILAQTDDERVRVALDVFIVSFGLMGANMADLYVATPFRGEWVYNRSKTASRRADRAEMKVSLPGELEPYISRLQEAKGSWWLPVLHEYSSGKDRCSNKVNRYLKRWAAANEVPEFTFYAARHTWASLARRAGVEKATIDECLIHRGTFKMADIYAERSWELMQDANRKVLDLFQW